MEITEQREGATLVLTLEGRLDTLTSPSLEGIVANADALAGVEALVLDIAAVEYVSSAGLRVVLQAHKAMEARKGAFVVRHPNEYVAEVFQVTGFADILTIEA